MLSFSGSLKVFVAVEPCDMRRSFNGLHDAVTTRLMENPKSGSIYAFTNKRRTLLKILYWDAGMAAASGFWQRDTLHNARISLFSKILYPYHPLFGKDCSLPFFSSICVNLRESVSICGWTFFLFFYK
jgi:hypothetical protein